MKTPNTLSNDVAAAFGVNADISLLPGGIDLKTFRSGDVVLRYLGENAEEVRNWNAELFNKLDQQGFRVARPIRATNSSWVVNGWVAEQFLQGHVASINDILTTIQAVTAFHKALIGTPLPEYRKREQTMWDRADQWAWGDIPEDIDPNLYQLASRLTKLRKPVDLPSQLIHGDLNLNNILIAKNLPPAIIDLAPYWRPVEFALAVMAFWVGPYEGNPEILEQFRHIREFDQMLIRAGLRMILTQKDPQHATGLEEYGRAVEVIEQFVDSHQ